MEIISQRFLLRDFAESDGPAFLAYHADPRYAEFYAPEEVGPDQGQELLQRFSRWATERPRRNYQFAIAYFGNPRELVGCCGLRGEGFGADRAELGIELAPLYWGRYGYAIEIASALLKFGFRDLELTEVRGFSNSGEYEGDAAGTSLRSRGCRHRSRLRSDAGARMEPNRTAAHTGEISRLRTP